jgi:alkyl hydroperoxide reductase subunit F
MASKPHDLIIIGGGPAGTAAAVYAARKRLKTVLITEEWGGQSNVSLDVQNWIGIPHLSGAELARKFEEHVREYANEVVDIISPARVVSVSKSDNGFAVSTDKDKTYQARAAFVAVGSHRRKLPAKGADEFEHRGLTYCASCDGPLFSGRDVAVIGGGNAGFETAAQLLAYTNSVTLLEFGGKFPADEITVEKLLKNPKFKAITNAETTEVLGEPPVGGFVTGIIYKDRTTGKEHKLDVGGVFVEIGLIPNTDILTGLLELDKHKRVIADPYTQRTSVEGIWAAGDCTDVRYHQNNIAAGDAVKAIEDMYGFLR